MSIGVYRLITVSAMDSHLMREGTVQQLGRIRKAFLWKVGTELHLLEAEVREKAPQEREACHAVRET